MGKILIIVEGEKEEFEAINKFFGVVKKSSDVEIVPFKSNIYTLYDALKGDNEGYLELIELLKERSSQKDKEKLSDEYEATYLVFDYEFHDTCHSEEEKQNALVFFSDRFNNSTDDGQLILSYPMVESLYSDEMDPEKVRISKFKEYKRLKQKNTTREKILNCNKKQLSEVFELQKRYYECITGEKCEYSQGLLLEKETCSLKENGYIFAISTIPFILVDYYGESIFED